MCRLEGFGLTCSSLDSVTACIDADNLRIIVWFWNIRPVRGSVSKVITVCISYTPVNSTY